LIAVEELVDIVLDEQQSNLTRQAFKEAGARRNTHLHHPILWDS
jgi:hypothetical protein